MGTQNALLDTGPGRIMTEDLQPRGPPLGMIAVPGLPTDPLQVASHDGSPQRLPARDALALLQVSGLHHLCTRFCSLLRPSPSSLFSCLLFLYFQ